MKKKGMTIECNITRAQEEFIKVLVHEGLYPSRSEFIRQAIDSKLKEIYEERKKSKTSSNTGKEKPTPDPEASGHNNSLDETEKKDTEEEK